MAGKNLTDVYPMKLEENDRMVTQALRIFEADPIDLSDTKAVQQRIIEYFNSCRELGMRPGNMGMYGALGLSRQDVNNAITGKSRKLSLATIDTIKKAIIAMSSYREMLSTSGKMNPVTYIFQAKNFDGMRDEHHLEIENARRYDVASMTPEQIAQRIEKDIPIDDVPADPETADVISFGD